ncbi:hypothetical protein P7K49_032673 [Saguinus oedipus]|uniref:Uncharacterized protein n=1 Tax=Saguinus oedipus TaxID=9490 RepID=A0ABQ9TQ52_SAGOE|nr:hypothetical protein P7K49_032673 [Saguinus oedipus]
MKTPKLTWPQSSGTPPRLLWTGRPGCGVWGWWDGWDPPWEGGFLLEAAEDNAGKGIDVGGGLESPQGKKEVPMAVEDAVQSLLAAALLRD